MASVGVKQNQEAPVLHVVVVGFHHKKGCQVEYSYPPLIPGSPVDSHDLPEEWRHLPSMALPDGAHNHVKDTIYFHLPSCETQHKTVYGVSCYRQMDAKDLVNKTSDVTRSSVQKSVCVLSRLPLYGLIQAKLELITHAYFDERDFTKVELLEQTYKHLNATLTESLMDGSRLYLGLSPRDVVLLFKHKIVLLLKLLLLERRVLFTGGPVEKLCSILLTIISLIPGMLEFGLEEASNYSLRSQLSPTLKLSNFGIDMEDYLEISYRDVPNHKAQTGLSKDNSPDPEVDRLNKGHNSNTANEESDGKLDKGDNSSPNHFPDNAVNNKCDIPSNMDPLGLVKADALVNDNSASEKGQKLSDNVIEKQPLGDNNLKTELSPNLNNVDHNKSKVAEGIENRNETFQDSIKHHSDPLFSDDSLISTPEKVDPLLNILTTDRTKTNGNKQEVVKEIDSPESISEIDKEDGFLWEQDKLLLEIDQELSEQNDVFDESQPGSPTQEIPANQTMDRTTDTDPTTGLVETSDDDGSFRVVTKVASLKKTGQDTVPVHTSPKRSAKAIRNKLSNTFKKGSKGTEISSRDTSPEKKLTSTTNLQQDEYGFPLAIFTEGSLCQPYLCLQYYDLLQDVNVKSFVIGATNVLFKQKRHLTDVVIDVNDGKIDVTDVGLRRQLQMTTADLRFADILVKAVSEETNTFLEGTEWEGGDQWLRAQCKSYLLGLLTSASHNDDNLLEDYGQTYIQAWKLTHNYCVWKNQSHPSLELLPSGHPCQGNLTMNDIRVRFTSVMQGSERGRKINSAMNQTGKYVAQTGRAVGGALNQAKSTVTSWFNTWRSSSQE